MSFQVTGPEIPHKPRLDSFLAVEVQRVRSPIRQLLVPAVWSFSTTLLVLGFSFGTYAVWQHMKNGYSYSQIVSSDIGPISSTGNSLTTDQPADSPSSSPSSSPHATSGSGSTPTSSGSGGGGTYSGSNGGSSGGSSSAGGGDSSSPPPSSPASQSSNCLPKPSACGFPDASNTGVPAGTTLTSHPGSQKITQDGAVIDGWDTGRINIYANNVVIKNTKITTSAYYGVYVYSGSVIVEDTTIVGQATASQECDAGVTGAVLVLRVDISGCEDGVHLSGNHAVKDSYIHSPYFTSSSHNDGIQVFSASGGMVLQHNTINMTGGSKAGNSCVFVQPTSGSVDNVKIDSNLIDGAGYSLYIEQSTNVTLSYNRVGRDYVYGWFSHAHNTNAPTLVSNVWDDTNTPAT